MEQMDELHRRRDARTGRAIALPVRASRRHIIAGAWRHACPCRDGM